MGVYKNKPHREKGMKGRGEVWMLLRRVSLITDAKLKSKDSVHPKTQNPAREEIEERMNGADVTKDDKR